MSNQKQEFEEFVAMSNLKDKERAEYCEQLRANIQQLTTSTLALRTGKDSLFEKFFDECLRANLDALKTMADSYKSEYNYCNEK